jgi:hypothetical protein
MRADRIGRLSLFVGVLLSLASARGRAEPNQVGGGDLATWTPLSVELKKGLCYTFTIELEDGATLSPELQRGDVGVKAVAGKFSWRPLSFPFAPSQVDRMRAMVGGSAAAGGAKEARRFTAPLTPCESVPATITLVLKQQGTMKSVTSAGSGKFKLLVATRKATKRDLDDGIRASSGSISDAIRSSKRSMCESCVKNHQGDLPGFRNCLSDREIKASDCL